MMDDYTVVIAVDRYTIEQLRLTWPTWRLHKPSLFERPMIVIYDRQYLTAQAVMTVIGDHSGQLIPWPPKNAEWQRTQEGKWGDPQRAKMLSSFVHVPAEYVKTLHWLKLDTDAVAIGCPDWDKGNARPHHGADIIAPRWGYTKPANQMMALDYWASSISEFKNTEPLRLEPLPDTNKVVHNRICSWCAFFSLKLTALAANLAEKACPVGHIPVPSQDGYMWYLAKRLGFPIQTVRMKSLGWTVCNRNGLAEKVKEVMQNAGN